MKKIILMSLILFPVCAQAQVYITEIMYDLSGLDEKREWVEILNTGPVYDLSSWRLSEGGTDHVINYVNGGQLPDGQLFSDEYAIIADDANQFLLDHPDYTGKLYDSSFSLSNNGEVLLLKSGSNISDEISYSSSTGARGDGNSLQKNNGIWIADVPTPGKAYSTASSTATSTVEMTPIPNVIDSDTILFASSSPYSVNGLITVTASTTLRIEPGTIVKVKGGGTGRIEIRGRLEAQGTSDKPITFTSALDTPSPRDWQGIVFQSGSFGELDHAEIRFGGYDGFGIKNDGGSIEIRDSIIENNYDKGILQNSGTSTISNSIIRGNTHGLFVNNGLATLTENQISSNSLYGIYAQGDSAVSIFNNVFSGNLKTAFIEASVDFSHSGNTSADLYERGFEMAGYARSGAVWHSDDLPIINIGILTVSAGNNLTLLPGTVIKMVPGLAGSASLSILGNLNAIGTKEKAIEITSLRDDSVGGDTNVDASSTLPAMADWKGITFQEGSTGDLAYLKIRYAGSAASDGTRAAISNNGGQIRLVKGLFSDNLQEDYHQKSGSITASSTDFRNPNFAVVLEGGEGTLSDNKFNKTSTGIENRSTSMISAIHNWWGDKAGPRLGYSSTSTGAWISGPVIYEPWIRRDPALPNPVIIIPGIMGSTLYEPDVLAFKEIWPNIALMIMPGTDLYLEALSMDINGDSTRSIYPHQMFIEVAGQKFFSGLIEKLISDGYSENISIFEFPYDWRLDINKSSQTLSDKINEVKSLTGTEQVDIIAHSMGGLLVKKYLKEFGGDSISEFIDIGIPNTGAPKALKILNFGDNFGFEKIGFNILNLNRVKSIAQNMASVYELLPSRAYFDSVDNDYKYYVFDAVGAGRLSFDQTTDYLKSSGRNPSLVDRADAFHQEIDGLNPADYGVETYNIVGCGTPTIGQIYVLSHESDHYSYNIKMINGDGTVPLKSAEVIAAKKTYFVKGAQHATMPSTSGVKELVASILSEEDFDMSKYSNMTARESDCPIPDGKVVSFHSPIDLHVYDSADNHTGPNNNGDFENNIQGASYEIIGEDKFAFLPDGQQYRIIGSSTASGVFDLRIESMKDGEVSTTTLFNDVPISLTTRVQFGINSNIPDYIMLDQDGNGAYETSLGISTTTVGFLESDGKPIIVPPHVPEPEPESELEIPPESGPTFAEIKVQHQVTGTHRRGIQQEEGRVLGAVTASPEEGLDYISATPEIQRTSPSSPAEIHRGAAAYQSFGGRLMDVFKSLWSWIKSKL